MQVIIFERDEGEGTMETVVAAVAAMMMTTMVVMGDCVLDS